MDGETRYPNRQRLPNRRASMTETILIGNMTIEASIGFGEGGKPQAIFHMGAHPSGRLPRLAGSG